MGRDSRLRVGKLHGEDVLTIRMDRKTRHLRITAPDDFELAKAMLGGALKAFQAEESKRAAQKLVVPATPGDLTRMLGLGKN